MGLVYHSNKHAKTRDFASNICDNACMDLNWDDYKTVLHLVRGQSLARAAKSLDVNYTTIARRITRAETALGQTLFNRLPSGYIATNLAEQVAKTAYEMEKSSDNLLRRVIANEDELSGSLTITAPQLLISNVIAPVLKEFGDAHPNVVLNVKATNEALDLNRREADIALRISNTPDENLVGLRLAKQKTGIFACEKLANDLQDNPNSKFDWIWFEHWKGLSEEMRHDRSDPKPRYVFDDMIAVIGAAKAGLGAVRLPLFLGRSTEGLKQLRIIEPQPYIDIWVLTHSDMKDAPKVRAFKDLLIPFFKKHKADFVD